MKRLFGILVVLACLAVLPQAALQAQSITVDNGVNSDVYGGNGAAAPGASVVAGITIVGNTTSTGSITAVGLAAGGIGIANAGPISGATTIGMGGALTGATTINATGLITGVGLAAGAGTITGGAITSTGLITGVGVNAGTGQITGTGGAAITGGTTTDTLSVTGDATIDGILYTNGIDNNGEGITNAGRISGVSNGIASGDAVNRGQLDAQNSSLSSGIASIAALNAIPCPILGKNYSVGVGYGHYNGESAYAIGAKANIPQSNISVAAGVGFSNNSSPAINAGASFSF